MNEFLEFIINNWQWLISATLALFSFILLLLRKKPTLNIKEDILNSVYEQLPYWINAAEDKFGSGHGADKFQYVLIRCIKFLGVDSVALKDSGLYSSIKTMIEDILSTPQKG